MKYDTYIHYNNDDSKKSHSDQVSEPMIKFDLHSNSDRSKWKINQSDEQTTLRLSILFFKINCSSFKTEFNWSSSQWEKNEVVNCERIISITYIWKEVSEYADKQKIQVCAWVGCDY